MDLKSFCTKLESDRNQVLEKLTKAKVKLKDLKTESQLKETSVANWKKTQKKYEEKLEKIKTDVGQYQTNVRTATRMIQQYESNLEELAFYKKAEKKALKEKIQLFKEQLTVASEKIIYLTQQQSRIQTVINNLNSDGLGDLMLRVFQLDDLIPQLEEEIVSLEIDLDMLHRSAVKRYGEERQGFLEWFKKELPDYLSIAKSSSVDVDVASDTLALITKSLRSKDKFSGDLFVMESEERVKRATENLKNIRQLRTKADSEMQAQRNLKVKTLFLTLKDVAEHQTLTDQVYESMQQISALILQTALCEEMQKNFDGQIQSLVKLASSDGDFALGFVQEMHKTLSAILQNMENMSTRLWGKVITEKGAKFIDLAERFKVQGEPMRASCLKGIEQGESFLPEAAERVKRLHLVFETTLKQQMGLLSKQEAQRQSEALKKVVELRKAAETIANTIKENYPLAITELNNLRNLLGDV